MRKELFYRERSLGVVGECTGVHPKCGSDNTISLKVGDLVSFCEYGKIYTKVVGKNYSKNKGTRYGIFGFGMRSLDFDMITRIMSHKDLTEDIFQKTQEQYTREERSMFTIRSVTRKEMTIEQVQEELGYPIKIVGSEPDGR